MIRSITWPSRRSMNFTLKVLSSATTWPDEFHITTIRLSSTSLSKCIIQIFFEKNHPNHFFCNPSLFVYLSWAKSTKIRKKCAKHLEFVSCSGFWKVCLLVLKRIRLIFTWNNKDWKHLRAQSRCNWSTNRNSALKENF